MFLSPADWHSKTHCLPRIRGGVSNTKANNSEVVQSSPHTRGCFRREQPDALQPGVFPAYAGVFLSPRKLTMRRRGLPRIRGGVSLRGCLAAFREGSSPHTRGCFFIAKSLYLPDEVFPAYAGVFPAELTAENMKNSLPRIRGGVSELQPVRITPETSSPHTRGCFLSPCRERLLAQVFPAYAGVFPRGRRR